MSNTMVHEIAKEQDDSEPCEHSQMIDDKCRECGDSCSWIARDEDDWVCRDTECPIHGSDKSVE